MPDLEDVIQQSLGAATGSEGGDESVVSTEVEETDEGATAETPEAESTDEDPTDGDQPSEGDQPAQAATTAAVTETPKPKRGPIPFDRHQAILTKARRDAEAAQAELKKQLDELAWAKSPETRAMINMLRIAETQPDVFAKALLTDPRYAKLLRFAEAEAAETAAAKPQDVPSDAPKPDALLADGSVGYSEEGLQKLVAYHVAKTAESVEKKLSESFKKEYGPLREKHLLEEDFQQRRLAQRKVLDNARENWAGFKDHEPAIQEYIVANPTSDLNEAYRAVVIPKLQADRDAMREQILAEINQKPAASVQPPAARTTKTPRDPNEPREIEDVILESLKKARRQ